MKTKTITTPSCTLLVCELPEGAINPLIRVINNNCWLEYSTHGAITHKELTTLNGFWQTINRLPEVTEEQAFGLVDHYEVSHNIDLTVAYAFKDYVNGIERDDVESCDCDYWDEYSFDTAIESLNSLLESDGVCFKNHYGKEPDYGTDETETISDWLEAQSKVWDKEHCYLFIKVG